MRYNFIEIGSCDFDTFLQKCSDEEMGITVEPIRKYLDNLPIRENVKKVCAAVVPIVTEDINVYFIDSDDFDRDSDEYWPGKKFPGYLRGCNSVSKPHDYHVACPENLWVAQQHGANYPNVMKTYNLLETGLVKVEKCSCITFEELVKENNVSFVNQIKLDTEGQDCVLLNSILDFYEKRTIQYPKIIQFESNMHNEPDDVDRMCKRLTDLGYRIENWDGRNYPRHLHDCVAELIQTSASNSKSLNNR